MKTIATLLLLASALVQAQPVYMTRNGQITFFSKTPMEDIDAVNNEVTSLLNTETGELVYAVLIKSFRFERALMEEHFNENYMESTQFPKATFQGTLLNKGDIDFATPGTYRAQVEGEILIHGVKKPLTATGTLQVQRDKIAVDATFQLKPKDFNITIPALVADKIAEAIDVKVTCQYTPKK